MREEDCDKIPYVNQTKLCAEKPSAALRRKAMNLHNQAIRLEKLANVADCLCEDEARALYEEVCCR